MSIYSESLAAVNDMVKAEKQQRFSPKLGRTLPCGKPVYELVRDIHATGKVTNVALAKRFGCTEASIRKVISNKSYRV